MPQQVMHVEMMIGDPEWRDPQRVQFFGSKMIEELRHKLPQGAVVRDTQLDLIHMNDRLAVRLRMSARYEVPHYSKPMSINPNYFHGY